MSSKAMMRLKVFFSILFFPLCQASTALCTDIQGTIHYKGNNSGIFLIAALSEGNLAAVACQTDLSTPGSYTLSCPPGDYYVVAQLDIDGNGALSFDNPLEPLNDYEGSGPEGKVTVGSDSLEGIDIHLNEIKEGCLGSNYSADYFSDPSTSNGPQDMGLHDGFLWICDATWNEPDPDLHKVSMEDGSLVESMNLGVFNVSSLEWVENDLWVCYKDSSSWNLKKFTYNGTGFTPDVSYQLPSTLDGNVVWSINLAWDGSLMWAQEKGGKGNIYKINLANGNIAETISSETFGQTGSKGIADISDIFFSDGLLWGMDDGNPIILQIDPITFEQHHIYFSADKTDFGDGGKYTGAVLDGEQFYFFQRNSQGPFRIYTGTSCSEKPSGSILWLTLPAILGSSSAAPSGETYTLKITNRSIDQTVHYVNAAGENASINIPQNETTTLTVPTGSALEATVFNPNGPTGGLMIDGGMNLRSGCISPPGPASLIISKDAELMITDC